MLRFCTFALAMALASSGLHAVSPTVAPSKGAAVPTPSQPVDVNRASVSELMQVPGITRVWAERIVRFRPYRTKQDLVEDGILPGAVYGKIKDYVVAHRLKP